MNNYPLIVFYTHLILPITDVDPVDIFVQAMEVNNVKKVISLSLPLPVTGTNKAWAFYAKMKYPEKFIVFTAIDYRDISSNGFTENAIQRLEEEAAKGAQGIKMHVLVRPLIVKIHSNDSRLKVLY